MKKVDCGTSIVLIILSIVGFINTFSFKGQSGLVPRLTLIVIFVCAIKLLINSIKSKTDTYESKSSINWRRLIRGVIITTLYIILIPILGFYISTLLYFFVILYVFGMRDLRVLIGVPFGFCIIIYLSFSLGLNIIMPASIFS